MVDEGDFGGGTAVDTRPAAKRQPFRLGQFFQIGRAHV